MVAIEVAGKDRTTQLSDWSLSWSDSRAALQLTCHFPSGKTYTHPLSDCRVLPTRELTDLLLTEPGSTITKAVSKAIIYGERYAAVYYQDDRPYLYKMDRCHLTPATALKASPVFHYFSQVANARRDRAVSKADRAITANVVRQLEKLPARADTALNAYCTGRNGDLASSQGLIYPFGLNESQLSAVEQAFRKQISVIEGPPGTGKTQTILNILANILLRGQTVAVLSNNNAAVKNVYEKLEKCGLDYLIAKLGNRENREAFFADLPPRPTDEPEPAPTLAEIQALLSHLRQLLHSQNRVAQLQAELDELAIERRYLQQWQADSGVESTTTLDKYGLSPRQTTDLMAYLAHLGEQRIRLKDRLDLLFKFGIFRTRSFAAGDARLAVFHALQLHYYDKTIKDKEAELQACHQSLIQGNFTTSLEALKTGSMRYLKQHLQLRVPPSNNFDGKTYRREFDAFIRRFPIIGSGTHSLVNSLAQGAVLDYVIIDEASLQDIVPGILPLGCAKNLIVVGDNRQLPHIPVKLGLQAPSDAYDCERHSLLDSCLAVFQEELPRTLLKEHYRCHPRIIQFCNQQFYDNALIPMTQDQGEAPLRLIVTAKGNHTRRNTNVRELDSLLKVLDEDGEPIGLDSEGRGFIAPFRAQVSLSNTHLPADFIKDTVHKFQGRECNEIVFSTVLDKKGSNQKGKRLEFVDAPAMINVAVSRAKHRFTLVTGDDVFTRNNGHIAALIRYISYYAENEQIVRAPVISAFDLLYREYDLSLERLRARLRPTDSRYRSEQIVAQLLREALSAPGCQSLGYHAQVKLDQIASPHGAAWTTHERAFMARASCDFVIYFKVGKTPIGVIEVDGGSHDRPDQAARDALKNGILAQSAISILRLRTVESQIEDRIHDFIGQWASPTSGGPDESAPPDQALDAPDSSR